MPYRHTGGAEEWLQSFLTSVPNGGVCVASITPRPLYSLYAMNKGLGGPKRRSARFGGEKNLYPPWDSNPAATDLICVLSVYKCPKAISMVHKTRTSNTLHKCSCFQIPTDYVFCSQQHSFEQTFPYSGGWRITLFTHTRICLNTLFLILCLNTLFLIPVHKEKKALQYQHLHNVRAVAPFGISYFLDNFLKHRRQRNTGSSNSSHC
jgi:hypothetical protein